jgi:hypothetical protein
MLIHLRGGHVTNVNREQRVRPQETHSLPPSAEKPAKSCHCLYPQFEGSEFGSGHLLHKMPGSRHLPRGCALASPAGQHPVLSNLEDQWLQNWAGVCEISSLFQVSSAPCKRPLDGDVCMVLHVHQPIPGPCSAVVWTAVRLLSAGQMGHG